MDSSQTPLPTARPACRECRRRKLGCSKELPTCKECRRLGAECIYEAREKPGLKPGAVENLNRRVDRVEQLLQQLQQQTESAQSSRYAPSPTWRNGNNQKPREASELLQLFEREMKEFKMLNNQQAVASSQGSVQPENESIEVPKRTAAEFSPRHMAKRRRLISEGNISWGELVLSSDSMDKQSSEYLLDGVLDNYFSQIHPWLPMLHQATLRQRLAEQVYDEGLELILHAMVAAAVRFAIRPDTSESLKHTSKLTKRSRDWVLLYAFRSLSVENLQALSILAFDDIGRGEADSAWSIVGSLTRTVEYLQLSVEVDETDEQPLLKPCPYLSPCKDWTETETRRRVFWNIFNLDRLCSVMKGWNTSLTSDDVHRRLPVDGVHWRKRESVIAPYFGIWDKSAGRIGNSIAYLTAQYPTLAQSPEDEHQSPGSSMSNFSPNSNTDSMSAIGAFAYCIEATESMSRVTTYFLQQKVNLKDQKQIGSWLMRFKELDLRLVHWKMFLPVKWKDTNVSRRPTEIIMDPNLTLAHITHNASMILLHQLIAYPPEKWDWATRLPSRCSADTCQTAALETSSITEKYLWSPTSSKIVNSQFTFCVFLAARVLLVHWRYYGDKHPLPEFFKLIESLDTISNRWEGSPKPNATSRGNLAAKYAGLLRQMYERCTNDLSYRVEVLAYANELGVDGTNSPRVASTSQESASDEEDIIAGAEDNNRRRTTGKARAHIPEIQEVAKVENQAAHGYQAGKSSRTGGREEQFRRTEEPPTPMSVGPAPAQLPVNQQMYPLMHPPDGRVVPGNIVPDEFTYISQMFLNQQFLDRDRVITYDEGMFASNMEGWDENTHS
ncbi:hypothetical protein V495_03777 [Pseudogymnoascus sp. VKM F-4514 (FW-929)]|nr:hypothetical protein V495_03777 [Pseudogymnoascus sp. VKM F-4514 (FW-929)]KFY60580.1 hypothetical protein V497_03531 [Pseudogymnoascus sp. VKM F-4516 (FW-969)]